GADLEGALVPLLSDPDAHTREYACLALADCREGSDSLVLKLGDPQPSVRRAAAATLGELGEEAAEHAGEVLKLLFDNNSYVCATAARALVGFGAEGAKVLMDRLLDEEEDDQLDVEANVMQRVVLDAIQAADAKFIEPYLHVLVVFLAASQPEIRLAAWSCLSKVSDKGFQSLVKRAHDPHVVVRKGVAEAIAFLLSSREPSPEPTFMEKEAMQTLAQQLTDPSDVVRLQAAEAFRRIGLPLAEAHAADLASRLKEHDIRIYCPVMDTLGDLGDIAAPYTALLRARLEVPDWKVRVSAARALGKLGEAALASAQLLVLRLEEDPHLEVKLCAVQALGELGGASLHAASQIASMHANCLASHMIMDEAPKLRRACARTLGCLGTYASTCLHELVLALADSDLEVRRQAVSALTGLGESAAPEVVAIIRSAEDIVVTDC
ncbi:HEAT repeat-containing PBS lyase, partial [Durusdinium trenchii]